VARKPRRIPGFSAISSVARIRRARRRTARGRRSAARADAEGHADEDAGERIADGQRHGRQRRDREGQHEGGEAIPSRTP
jgi:hypothetical protein